MDRDNQEDIVLILAGLLGVVLGQAIRRWRKSGAHDSEDRFTGIGVSALVATPALAHIAGDALHVDRADTRGQAALSFCVGAALSLFADEIARYLPRSPLAKRHLQD